MTQCWSEGELRAYLDHELPARDMERVAAHVRECSGCGGVCRELTVRADRVSGWMDALPDEAAPTRIPATPRRARAGRRWAGAAVGLAAAVLLGVVLLPKRSVEIVVKPPGVAPQGSPSAPVSVKPAIIRQETPSQAAPVKLKPQIQYFVALDNEPIETGLVVRVGLNGGQLPADVIVGPDGRARAIRLVSENSGELK
jgi:Putative zinc-finger